MLNQRTQVVEKGINLNVEKIKEINVRVNVKRDYLFNNF